LLNDDHWRQHLPNGLVVWVSNPKAAHNSKARQKQLLISLSAEYNVNEIKTRDKGLHYFALVPRQH